MPIPSILISLSLSGCAAYFMVEYQFSIYIIEDFAKKTNFKMLAHTEYSFFKFGVLSDFDHISSNSSNSHA